MTFLASLLAQVLEWLLSKGLALVSQEFRDWQAAQAAKTQADQDAKNVTDAGTDENKQADALDQIAHDAFGPGAH